MIRKVPFSFLLFFSFASVSEQPNTGFRVLTASFCSLLLILVEGFMLKTIPLLLELLLILSLGHFF